MPNNEGFIAENAENLKSAIYLRKKVGSLCICFCELGNDQKKMLTSACVLSISNFWMNFDICVI